MINTVILLNKFSGVRFGAIITKGIFNYRHNNCHGQDKIAHSVYV